MSFPSGKKNILVTGCAGFLGSHLCDELVKENNVIGVDNFLGGALRNIEHLMQNPNFRFLKEDVNAPLDLETRADLKIFQINLQGVQEIYHFACPTSAKNFDKYRHETLKAHSIGMLSVLELAKKYKAKFLFPSSSVVYGQASQGKEIFSETDFGSVNFTSPRACYDEGKRFAETAVITYKQVYNLDARIARVFRTYGPRMPLFDGQMISDFILQALTNKPLIIYGDEHFTTSLIYYSDVIQGLIKLMDSSYGEPVNFGNSMKYFLKDIAQKIIEMTESQSKIEYKAPLLFMTPLGLPDTTRAKNELEWFPVVTLEGGLREMIEYSRAHQYLLEPLVSQYDKE
ncbi:MAG: GDP-mannose 4,6-dehydratase [Parcubacteria group bacterium]|nr:GDP-mannose 4,6-dehydratase [Parcubacteria group bacterium]